MTSKYFHDIEFDANASSSGGPLKEELQKDVIIRSSKYDRQENYLQPRNQKLSLEKPRTRRNIPKNS